MEPYSPKPSPSPLAQGGGASLGPADPSSSSSSSANAAADAAGLKMTISLKQKSPFYLVRPESAATPHETTLTGATNLMAARGLEHSYNKLATKKMSDTLSSFLPHLPGVVDTPGHADNSSLRGLIDKPPVGGKELTLLTPTQLAGFRLHPGPLPEEYRDQAQQQGRHKAKHKRHRPWGTESAAAEAAAEAAEATEPTTGPGGGGGSGKNDEEREKKREKKHKRHSKDEEERKRRKKEKKRKKNKEDKE